MTAMLDRGTQTRLRLPPPSLCRAYLSVAEALHALDKSRGDAIRREEARQACQALARTLEERGANRASAEAWIMSRHVEDAAHDSNLQAIEERCREMAAGCEDTHDGGEAARVAKEASDAR